ncbi:MarC family protein [Sulfurovum sp.]|uniref:MarC family protein n=1 Tax=Sulfurovum sp. TaxID=1969726 RepID=UPI0025E7AE6C|nr:MarC family protein [Sulfurovum sp.]
MIQTYLSLLLHDTIGLITILNPIAAASIMVSMVDDTTASNMRSVAFKATMTVFIASLVTLFGGEFIFKLFGINVMSIKVIGGVILMLIAINMAYGQSSKSRHTQAEHDEAQEKDDVSIVPLGIPILFGPGVIATIIVLNNNISSEYSLPVSYTIVSISLLFSAITVFLSLRYAGGINKVLGITGMKVLTRIMGLVVGAIAAQFLVSGIKGLWGQ